MRRLASLLGALLLVPALPLSFLSVTTPVSTVGFLYVIGAVLVVGGLLSAPLRIKKYRGITRAGFALLIATAAFRITTAAHGTTLSMTRGASNAPTLDRLLPESDVAITSARAVILTGMLPANDTKNLVSTLRRSYLAMDAAEGSYPSPIVMTSLNLQKKAGFDTLVISAPVPNSHSAVLFLHGYGGNFTLQCWMVAQAARKANAATYCPSTRMWGDWWRGDGPQITRDVLANLKANGFDRIVLAGLSNGGLGASQLAPSLRGKIVGLLLISGAMNDALPSGVPTITFEGNDDTMMPPAIVREYAENTGATYIELPGTHFLLIEKAAVMTDKMGTWLTARFAR
ncbi:MAG: alpha/beta hydrolase [Polyangiaceae bacterium]